MPFIKQLEQYTSVSVVGLDKNVGKTVTLNYILKQLQKSSKRIALTSIGIDGEGLDQVTQTPKPEIVVYDDMLFVTSEKHYASKQIISEICDVSDLHTSLGRLITARAIGSGKVLLSGPADTSSLLKVIEHNKTQLGVDLTLVDGALSRMSLASPVVTDALVLATGASYSINLNHLVRQTAYVCQLIDLQGVSEWVQNKLMFKKTGLWAITQEKEVKDLGVKSTLLLKQVKEVLFKFGQTVYVSGVVTDRFMKFLILQKECKGFTLIVRDFTVLFVSPEVLQQYKRKGGHIQVLFTSNLLAITVNPTAPSGYVLDSRKMQDALYEAIHKPVFNVKELD